MSSNEQAAYLFASGYALAAALLAADMLFALLSRLFGRSPQRTRGLVHGYRLVDETGGSRHARDATAITGCTWSMRFAVPAAVLCLPIFFVSFVGCVASQIPYSEAPLGFSAWLFAWAVFSLVAFVWLMWRRFCSSGQGAYIRAPAYSLALTLAWVFLGVALVFRTVDVAGKLVTSLPTNDWQDYVEPVCTIWTLSIMSLIRLIQWEGGIGLDAALVAQSSRHIGLVGWCTAVAHGWHRGSGS